jgi:hypothetical protein
MKIQQFELISVGLIIVYIAFFSHPAPQFIISVLQSPVGQALVLAAIVYVSTQKSMLIGLFLGIAYLINSFPTLEYLDEKDQKPTEKEQPDSGAPKVDMKSIGKLASILAGPGGKLPQEKGKDKTEPPPSKTPVKPHTPEKPSKGVTTEKFSLF